MDFYDDVGNGAPGALSGGLAGAKLGSMILPGYGTAIGAGAGTLLGGAAGIINGRRKGRLEDKMNRQAEEEYALSRASALRNAEMEKLTVKKADKKGQMVSELFGKALGEAFRGKGATTTMGYV